MSRKVAEKEWELSKFTVEDLNAELERRGYLNGVLVNRDKEYHYKHNIQQLDDRSWYCSDCEKHFLDTYDDVEIA